MSSLTNLIPKIEGFQPIPNAVMIPFMETQSAALAFGFGLNYEYGKRTIRSMSNEKFNSLTSEQVAEMSAQHSTVLLNRFIQAVPRVMPAQTEIFKQYVEIEKAKVLQNVELAKWIVINAPSILLTGEERDTIQTSGGTSSSPTEGGTSIIQDKTGTVTTTVQPSADMKTDVAAIDKLQHSIIATSDLITKLWQKGAASEFEITLIEQHKVFLFKNIALRDKLIKEYTIKYGTGHLDLRTVDGHEHYFAIAKVS